MPTHLEKLRAQLANGPARTQQLVEKIQLSQPTLSRAFAALGDAVVRLGAGPSIHFALRDTADGVCPQKRGALHDWRDDALKAPTYTEG